MPYGRKHTRNVSIPYGKGKDDKDVTCDVAIVYQFPMGKVKLERNPSSRNSESYQFPMGKVKENQFRAYDAKDRINSLWER